MQAIHSHHWLMSTPYLTWFLKCPPAVGVGFEPRLSDQEADQLTTKLTRGVYSGKSGCLVLPKNVVVLRKTCKDRHVFKLKSGQKSMKEQS